jgi:hypothetical protein
VGGETPDGTGLNLGPALENPARVVQRKLALAQLILGVPAILVIVFILVAGYRLTGRSLGDLIFWLVLLTILVVFGVYYVQAFLLLRRSGQK